MERKEISSFKYKRRIENFLDSVYNGKFGICRFTLGNGERGAIHIYNTKTKEHIASLIKTVLYTNDLSFI